MRNSSSKYFITIVISSFIFLCCTFNTGQCVSRSSGIGVKIGFWNISDSPTRISTSGYGKDASVDVSGIGPSLFFFSRVHNDWFLELNLGVMTSVHEEHTNYIVEKVDVKNVIPILFGVRYDIFSSRLPSAMKPYLSFGGGPYWLSNVKSENAAFGGEEVVESDLDYGSYLGGGMNLMMTSWLALNFDLKYHMVDFKSNSGIEFGTGLTVMWGKQQEVIRVQGIHLMINDIYPAYYQFYNTYPIALISVKNVAGYALEVNIKSQVRPFSERINQTGFIKIGKGKTEDIKITAIFGKRLQQVIQREPAVLDIEIEARAGKIYRKTVSAQVMIHTRNAWDGEMDKLSFFITPDNEEILALSREIINKNQLNSQNHLGNFVKAKFIFNELMQMGIQYHSDPNIPFYQDDRVQYATETLEIKTGDCDDLVVLYASLLESIGINTAFVEVKDPEKEMAHVYLLFDSGLKSDQGYLLSSNEKRFVIRNKSNGEKKIWIPVETTLIQQGFEDAWKSGATSYLMESIIRDGLASGWVNVLDIE